MAIAAYNSSFLVTAQPAISFTNEAMTDSGDRTTYTITNAAKRYLDILTAVVVQTSPDGSSWSTAAASTYTLKYVGGKVTFTSQQPVGTQVRLSSGKYYAYSTLANAHSNEFSGKVQLENSTVYNSGGTQSFTPTLFEGNLKCDQWWANEARLNALMARDLLVVSFVLPSGNRYEGYCYTEETSLKGGTKGVLEEGLSFKFTHQFLSN